MNEWNVIGPEESIFKQKCYFYVISPQIQVFCRKIFSLKKHGDSFAWKCEILAMLAWVYRKGTWCFPQWGGGPCLLHSGCIYLSKQLIILPYQQRRWRRLATGRVWTSWACSAWRTRDWGGPTSSRTFSRSRGWSKRSRCPRGSHPRGRSRRCYCLKSDN
jgi:hypothetical protein